MSMKEHINKIALLASAFIENMKKEVEARQDGIIGSNLLEEMGMEEDMTDKQLQNTFLADGSTIEEEVDTAAEGAEEEEETDVNTSSFVHMEENITTTHVMFHSASKSLLSIT